MEDLSDLIQTIRQQKERMEHPSTYAEKLIVKLNYNKSMTNQEYLDLRDEINDFMKSDASEDDKRKVSQYTESLVMVCSAIEQKLL